MDADKEALFHRLRERYQSGEVPWDDPLPPPEIMDFVPTLPIGRALDLGCGYGRASIYLAGLGWVVDGIDFIPEVIAEAEARAEKANAKVRFHVASIPDIDFLQGSYDLAIDVGCGHNLDIIDLHTYRDQLARLIRPGGFFLIFARLSNIEESLAENKPKGVDPEILREVFSAPFELIWSSIGETTIDDETSWASGWFRYQIIDE